MSMRYDVAIIGGGIIGSSIAYNISKRGMNVVLLEQGDVCSGTSSATAARLSMQITMPGNYCDLIWRSYNNLFALQEALDTELELRVNGGLKLLYNEFEVQAEQKKVLEQQQAGYDFRLLSREEALALEPLINREIEGAVLSKYDAQINPFLIVSAYVNAAKRYGARIITNAKVTGFTAGNTIRTIHTTAGDFKAELTICAAGIQSIEIGNMVGVKLPIHAERGCELVSERMPPLIKHNLNGVTQRASGNFILGDTHEEVSTYDQRVFPGSMAEIARIAKKNLPSLRNVKIVRAFAGIRCLPDDSLPVLGPVGRPENFWVALTHSAFRVHAEIGPLMARMVLGLSDIGEIPFFSFKRFLL